MMAYLFAPWPAAPPGPTPQWRTGSWRWLAHSWRPSGGCAEVWWRTSRRCCCCSPTSSCPPYPATALGTLAKACPLPCCIWKRRRRRRNNSFRSNVLVVHCKCLSSLQSNCVEAGWLTSPFQEGEPGCYSESSGQRMRNIRTQGENRKLHSKRLL